jgi:hypothetical protein
LENHTDRGFPQRPHASLVCQEEKKRPKRVNHASHTKFLTLPKLIRSRNGITLRIRDDRNNNALILETPGGQRITLQDNPGSVRVEDANGNSVMLSASGMTVNASAAVTVDASRVEVSAGLLTVNAGMSRFSGVVQCDTMISNSVISASYSPGAGNAW